MSVLFCAWFQINSLSLYRRWCSAQGICYQYHCEFFLCPRNLLPISLSFFFIHSYLTTRLYLLLFFFHPLIFNLHSYWQGSSAQGICYQYHFEFFLCPRNLPSISLWVLFFSQSAFLKFSPSSKYVLSIIFEICAIPINQLKFVLGICHQYHCEFFFSISQHF